MGTDNMGTATRGERTPTLSISLHIAHQAPGIAPLPQDDDACSF